MKKVGVLVFVVLLLVCSSFVFAQNSNESNSSTSSQQLQNPDKVKKAFVCLEEKVGSCTGLSVQEMALTILATPKDSTFDACVSALKAKMNNQKHWGNVRDTALAILALSHAGQKTQDSEDWLIRQNRTPTDLLWYLQQDSNTAVNCRIGYSGNDYSVIIDEEKKIDKNAGSCLTRAQSNFWFKVEPSCYGREFVVECDKDFIANLLYKNKDAPTIFVLEGTESSPAFGSIKLTVNSKCFGGSSCDYEATLWAALALLKKGYNIEEYIPYIIALSETSHRYLPSSFIYMLTGYEDYSSKLIADVKLGNYWLADKSSYNKYYDTALALLALSSSSSDQIAKSKDWLLFSQGTNGCWQNSVRETAMVLWALEGRSGRSFSDGGVISGGGVTRCADAGFFCILPSDCPVADKMGSNYFCGLSQECCKFEHLKSCSEKFGRVCSGTQVCAGNEVKTSDTSNCCLDECVDKPTQTECEGTYYYTCMDSCSDDQEATSYACNGGQTCCMPKVSSPDPVPSSAWWIWVLVVLIVLVLAGISFWYYKHKSKSSSASSSTAQSPPGFPPRPMPIPGRPMPMMRQPLPPKTAYPPMNKAPASVSPPSFRSSDRRDPEMSDTFKKLRDMSS